MMKMRTIVYCIVLAVMVAFALWQTWDKVENRPHGPVNVTNGTDGPNGTIGPVTIQEHEQGCPRVKVTMACPGADCPSAAKEEKCDSGTDRARK